MTGTDTGTSGISCAEEWRVSVRLSARSMCRIAPRSEGVKKLEATPRRPARAVRPTRWMKSSGARGRSKFTTCAMSST